MYKRVLAALLCASVTAGSPALAKNRQPELSSVALQQIQSRDYEVSKEIAFPAVMTVLQDSGYRIQAADKDTGLITGVASTRSVTTYNIFWGLGKKKRTPAVSAFIETRGTGTRIRLSFVLATSKSRIYGVASSDEEAITDPAAYRDAFDRIDKEIFVRQAMSAPTPRPQATSGAPPVATPTVATQPNGLTPNPPNMPSALNPDPK
jgi:hypothetical protein